MERGAYVNGASFAAANQRAMKLQDENEALKSELARYKTGHRNLKAQHAGVMEKITLMQSSLSEALGERQALRHTVDHLKQHTDHLQGENMALAKANARLRLILRQDPELSRKHREEVPRLTKLALSSKQSQPKVAVNKMTTALPPSQAIELSEPVAGMRMSLSAPQPPPPSPPRRSTAPASASGCAGPAARRRPTPSPSRRSRPSRPPAAPWSRSPCPTRTSWAPTATRR